MLKLVKNIHVIQSQSSDVFFFLVITLTYMLFVSFRNIEHLYLL